MSPLDAPWLTSQPLYDGLSSLKGMRANPSDVAGFVAEEHSYAPDLNGGVRVNILLCNAMGSWLLICLSLPIGIRPSRIVSTGGPMSGVGVVRVDCPALDGGMMEIG